MDGKVPLDSSKVMTVGGDWCSCVSGPDTILTSYAVGGVLSVLLSSVGTVNDSSCEIHVNTVCYV